MTGILHAQPRRNCGTMEHLEDQLDANPNMLYDIRRIERDTELAAKNMVEDNSLITIPLVIHVVYNSAAHNISDEQINSQIRVLNEDFRRRNPDQVHTDPQFRHLASDTKIQFKLADLDPNGEPTTGITRTKTSRSLFYSSDNAVKYSAMGGVDAWPTGEYLNIWICNLGSGILGYSQFPGGPSETDGVVIGYRYFGTIGPVKPPFNRGRTTTHEVGHWLNLRHIWGDGPCGADDHVDDTPLAERPHHGCLEAAESCGSPDMVQNFMDYTDDACMNLFSQGQASRMRALFSRGGSRESIRYSNGLIPEQEEYVETEPVIEFFAPENLTVNAITASTATLTWEEVPGAEKYKVRVRRAGEQRWATRTFAQAFVNANSLKSCTEYEFEVASLNEEEQSGFSTSFAFQTLGCTVQPVVDAGSAVPRNLQTTEVMGRQATLNWDEVPMATSYQVQYKQLGVKRVFTKLTYQPATVLYGLTTGERYLYRVRANFADGPGEYSKVSSFIPGSSSSLVSRQTSRMSQGGNSYFRVYPDRQSGMTTVELDFYEQEEVLISIVDRSGRSVEQYDPFVIYAGEPFDLDLGHLPAGTYSLQIEDTDGFEHVKQIRLD